MMNQQVITIENAWRKYQQQLLSYIRSKVKTTEDAEELLNDVFVKLTKTIANNNAPDNISAWLYHVTKNSIVDYYRTKKQFETLPDDLSDQHENTEEANVIRELSQCILPMIKALPEAYQQPLILSEINGNKYKEVATELGLSVSAVKSRILRGRQKLHKSLVSCCAVYRNESGETVDYEQKSANSCTDC